VSKRIIMDVLKWGILIAFLVLFLFPFFWIVASSLKSRGEFFTRPPVWFPAHLDWSNYPDSLGRGALKGLTDSFIIAFLSMLISLLLGAPAAYAIARFQVGRENLAFWILSIRMFPPIATILPLFVIFRFVGLVDSYSGLVLSYTVFNLPFAIWILKGFIEDLPREIEEAAKVDGARPFQIFRMIVIPWLRPV
jgi:multiple sugar transport system permease protein